MNNEKASSAKKFKILVAVILVAALSAGFYISQGKTIQLSVDGEMSEVVSHSQTVEGFLEKEEVRFDEGASLNVPLDMNLEDNLEIVIINPKPYTIKARDTLLEILSVHSKVKDILKDQNIELEGLDYVEPEFNKDIDPNTTIEIFRVTEEVLVEKSAIPFKEETRDTKKLEKGTKKVAQEGKEGLKETHIKNRYINGELESSTVEKEEVVKEPVTHIVENGTKPKEVAKKPVTKTTKKSSTTASRASSSSRGKKTIIMQATAYTDDSTSQGKWVGQTATGRKPQYGVVAVDPKVIPLGSKLYIEGYGNAVAGDTGGAIKGNRIDLFYNTRSEALKFGRRNVKVHILN